MTAKQKPVKKLVINRRRWLRGRTTETLGSALKLPGKHKYCCLGFYAKACGFTDEAINGVGSPMDLGTLDDDNSKEPVPLKDTRKLLKAAGAGWLLSPNMPTDSLDCAKLMNINDDSTIKAADREKAIKQIFKLHGVTVRFV